MCARSSLFLAYLGYGFIPLEGIGYGIMAKVGRKFQSNNPIRFSRIYVVWKNILNFSTEQPSCKLLLSILVLQQNTTRHTPRDFFKR